MKYATLIAFILIMPIDAEEIDLVLPDAFNPNKMESYKLVWRDPKDSLYKDININPQFASVKADFGDNVVKEIMLYEGEEYICNLDIVGETKRKIVFPEIASVIVDVSKVTGGIIMLRSEMENDGFYKLFVKIERASFNMCVDSDRYIGVYYDPDGHDKIKKIGTFSVDSASVHNINIIVDDQSYTLQVTHKNKE